MTAATTDAGDEGEPHVAISREGGLATARLVNPRKRNALTLDMWGALQEFALSVSADEAVRAVLIAGGEDAFSAGADIDGFLGARDTRDRARLYDDRLDTACAAIEAIRQPTVAMLAGPVVGAGLALAASCDLRVAADSAYLMVPAARLGLGYDPRSIARLSLVFGPALAREIMLTGARVPAARAHAAGAIARLVPASELVATTHDFAAALARNAPLTMQAAKVALRAVDAGNEPTLLDEAWRLTDLADASEDYAEGRAAFAERRSPRFTGR